MKRYSLAILFLLIIQNGWSQNSPVYYITADRVFDGEAIHEGWAVIISGNKISAIGPKERVKEPSGAIKINYPNSTLTPGLIEGHSHLLLYPYNQTDWDTQVLKETE